MIDYIYSIWMQRYLYYREIILLQYLLMGQYQLPTFHWSRHQGKTLGKAEKGISALWRQQGVVILSIIKRPEVN